LAVLKARRRNHRGTHLNRRERGRGAGGEGRNKSRTSGAENRSAVPRAPRPPFLPASVKGKREGEKRKESGPVCPLGIYRGDAAQATGD